MINLEIPKRLKGLLTASHEVGANVFRPISRKYDRAEHDYPKELDGLGAVMKAMEQTGSLGSGAEQLRPERREGRDNHNGANMAAVLGMAELCWGDVGLALTIPGQGLGNAAIAAVATPDQRRRFDGKWAAMAITEPGAGSDSAAIRTTAHLDGDEWILNGEKIFVTCGERADLIVVWATLDAAAGRAAIKSFVVETGTPGMNLERLDRKLGIRASDTASLSFTDCRIPHDNLLGSPEIEKRKGFTGVMKTFDNTRPIVAAMAVGLGRAALERTRAILGEQGITVDYRRSRHRAPAAEAELVRLEAELEAARLLALRAAWMADNDVPNSLQASMAKAKAGRVTTEITLRCVELCGATGYAEDELLEKWARDAKILDIFEGTQQIMLLIISRRLLGKSSSELR